jgi:hypothetical protein
LIAVGYWWSPQSKELPHPRVLVGEPYLPEMSNRICRYLLAGKVVASCFGYSYCRFDCGVDGSDMGNSDFTDGVWLWPQGLHHYVRHHHIRLPEQFIQAMRDSGWRVRVPLPPPRLDTRPDGSFRFRNYDFWIEWARQSEQPGR